MNQYEGLRRRVYRADIDGLRAIAVLFVVLFHAFPNVLGGGFVGVDVFFVVSGYLISGIVLAELQTGRFTLRQFYLRRARRILPAMVAMVAVSLIFGWFVLWPDEYALLGRDAVGAIFSIENVLLWHAGKDYFDLAASSQPLLHLWSLGIEEQFYLIWPGLLALTWRRGISQRPLIALGIAISLVAGIVLTAVDERAAFYLPFGRFWELLVGAGVAWYASRPESTLPQWNARSRSVLAAAGLFLILSSSLLLNETLVFSTWFLLAPVLGTALVIVAGQEAWLNRRLLAHPAMVWVGLISYPLYLWHWPLLSFGRILNGESLSVGARLALIAAAVLAAWLTFVFVERPIRFGILSRPRVALLVSALVLTGLGAVGVRATFGYPSRQNFTLAVDLDRHDTPATTTACPAALARLNSQCTIQNATMPATAAIIGDSHARRLFFGLAPALMQATGSNLVAVNCRACPLLFDIGRTDRPAPMIAAQNDSTLDYLAADTAIRTVFITSRDAMYLAGREAGQDTLTARFRLVRRGAGATESSDEAFANSLRTTLQRLESSGKLVVYIAGLPELDFQPRECFVPWPRRAHRPCAVSVAQYRNRTARYTSVVAAVLQDFPRVLRFEPSSYLCDDAACPAFRDGHLLFLDNNHLSNRGSTYLADALVRAVAAWRPPPTAKSQH